MRLRHPTFQRIFSGAEEVRGWGLRWDTAWRDRPRSNWDQHKGKPTEKNQNKRNPNKMKAIKMRIEKFSRPGVILMATVVAIITSMVVTNATQTITTPNAAFISYSLVSGGTSAAITPASSRSVLVMGCCTTTGVTGIRGVGQVSLLHLPSNSISWVGLESANAATTFGVSSTPGAHIVYTDFDHTVDIEVASADTILVHKGNAATRAGNVTLVW